MLKNIADRRQTELVSKVALILEKSRKNPRGMKEIEKVLEGIRKEAREIATSELGDSGVTEKEFPGITEAIQRGIGSPLALAYVNTILGEKLRTGATTEQLSEEKRKQIIIRLALKSMEKNLREVVSTATTERRQLLSVRKEIQTAGDKEALDDFDAMIHGLEKNIVVATEALMETKNKEAIMSDN
jgi:hypothetical protein